MFQLFKDVVVAEVTDFCDKILLELNGLSVKARTIELEPLCVKCTKIVSV